MASKYWIKLYIEILDDPKMGRMPDRLWRRTVELFLLAGEFSEDGTLPEIKDMSWRLRVNEDVLSDDLELLTTYGIVQRNGTSYIISKFAERQSPVSDGERNKRMRERKQKQQYYGDETVTNLLRNVTVADTNCNVDTDTDTESDTELTTAGAVFTAYEHEIGVITPHIAERLKDASELYTDGWLIDAIKIASEKQVRNMKYIEAILARWKAEGKDNGTRKHAVAKKPERKVHSGAELAKAWGVK